MVNSGGSEESAASNEPVEINLSSDEIEYNGIHLRLPDSLEFDDANNGEIVTVNDLNEPASGEVLFNAHFDSAESLTESGAYDEAVNDVYSPVAALIHLSSFTTNEYWEYENTRLGATDVQVAKRVDQGGDYESAEYSFILNSGIVTLRYDDRGGQHADLIQQSLDSIWIDEDEIPDIVRDTSPESLQTAGLRVQPWEVECESGSIYINMPEDYTPVKLDDGRLIWVSPDGQIVLSTSKTDTEYLLLEEADVADTLYGTPGFEGFDFFSNGNYHGMFCTEYQFKQTASNGSEVCSYALAVLPWRYGKEAVMVAIVSPSEDIGELQGSIDTLRYADGWNNGGVLDVDAIAVPESELG